MLCRNRRVSTCFVAVIWFGFVLSLLLLFRSKMNFIKMQTKARPWLVLVANRFRVDLLLSFFFVVPIFISFHFHRCDVPTNKGEAFAILNGSECEPEKIYELNRVNCKQWYTYYIVEFSFVHIAEKHTRINEGRRSLGKSLSHSLTSKMDTVV